MKTFTFQEMVDAIRDRFLDGKGRCIVHPMGTIIPVCRYRDETGNRCAVGALISDDQYTHWIEERSVEGDIHQRSWSTRLGIALARSGVPQTEQAVRLLILAQHCHDDEDNWDGTEYTGVRFWEDVGLAHTLMVPELLNADLDQWHYSEDGIRWSQPMEGLGDCLEGIVRYTLGVPNE